jgi:hypothetical protein
MANLTLFPKNITNLGFFFFFFFFFAIIFFLKKIFCFLVFFFFFFFFSPPPPPPPNNVFIYESQPFFFFVSPRDEILLKFLLNCKKFIQNYLGGLPIIISLSLTCRANKEDTINLNL